MTPSRPAVAVLAAAMSEDELLACVIDACRALGWKTAHFRPAKTERGWRTAVSGDGKGFFDLVLMHERMGEVLFVELKSERGKQSPEQFEWHRTAIAAGQRVFVWYPSTWLNGGVMRVLEGVAQ